MKVFGLFVLLSYLLVVAAESHYQSQHNPNGPVYDGLDSVIDEATKNTEMLANDLTRRMNSTFYAIKQKIEQWKNNNAFTKQLESFLSEGNQCIKEHELALAQFMRNLMGTYDSCSQEAKKFVSEKLNALKDSVSAIKYAPSKIEQLSDNCVKQENPDLAESSLCVVTQIAEIEHAATEANHFVEEFINHGVQEVEAFAVSNCKGIKDLDTEFVGLFNKIKTCIGNKEE